MRYCLCHLFRHFLDKNLGEQSFNITGPPNSLKLKPHCIRCSHFKVDDISALEPSSKLPVRIVEDNVTASATYTIDVDLLVPAGTSTRLD
jgi:hypothetical protein